MNLQELRASQARYYSDQDFASRMPKEWIIVVEERIEDELRKQRSIQNDPELDKRIEQYIAEGRIRFNEPGMREEL